eukprot:581331-Pelagomonas_calceolata.AAC.12
MGYIAVPAYVGSLAEARLQWDLTFSQVVWLLGQLNHSSRKKKIHEFGNEAINLSSVPLQGMKDILRTSLSDSKKHLTRPEGFTMVAYSPRLWLMAA